MLLALDPTFHELTRKMPLFMTEGHAAGLAVGPKAVGGKGIVLAGMGGSGAAGRLVWDAYHDDISVPLLRIQDGRLPGCVDAEWVVIAVSYSGETEETLAAVRAAKECGATVVGITSGGTLALLADHVVRPPQGLPPRAAMPFMWMALLGILQRGNIIPPIPLGEAVEAVERVEAMCHGDVPDNVARSLATVLSHVVPCFYGTPRLAGVAAFVAAMVNENSKRLAFFQSLPECNHNDLVGWSGDHRRKTMAAVVLSDEDPDNELGQRIRFMRERFKEWDVAFHEPQVGQSGANQPTVVVQARLLCLGAYVSLFLAADRGLDPGDIAVIDGLKGRLRVSEQLPPPQHLSPSMVITSRVT